LDYLVKMLSEEKEKGLDVNLSDIKSYKELANFLADNELDYELPNHTIEHAKLLCKLLIEKSQRQILIFTSNLEQEFYTLPEMQKAFNKAIQNGVSKIDIILDGRVDGNASEKFVKFAKEFNNPKIVFYISKLNVAIEDYSHFYVSDDKRVRIETEHDPILLEQRILVVDAKVNFNNPNQAKECKVRFDELKKISTPLIIPH
jgi:hypothetical protein